MLHIRQDKCGLADLGGVATCAAIRPVATALMSDDTGGTISGEINHDDIRFKPAAGLR